MASGHGAIMSTGDEGSITRWIGDLKAGGDSAAQHLWEQYFDRLVHLARSKLRNVRGLSAADDEEDVALSAFDSFCRRAADGRFPRLSDRDDLWRLLVVLTVRKAWRKIEVDRTKKRGGLDAGDELGLERAIGREPSPQFAAMVAEEYRRLRDALQDDSLRRVLDLRLEGYTQDEIAARLGCASRTVSRKLNVIRQTWLGADAAPEDR